MIHKMMVLLYTCICAIPFEWMDCFQDSSHALLRSCSLFQSWAACLPHWLNVHFSSFSQNIFELRPARPHQRPPPLARVVGRHRSGVRHTETTSNLIHPDFVNPFRIPRSSLQLSNSNQVAPALSLSTMRLVLKALDSS